MAKPAADRLAPADTSGPQTAGVKTMESETPPTYRLVVRVKMIPEGSPRGPSRRRLSKGALALILGAVAVLLGWVGISMLRTDPTSAPAATEPAPTSKSLAPAPAPSEPAPAISDEPLAKPVAETADTRREPADAPTSPINEVIPDVPRSARETIRGTVKVSIRVIVDKHGTVLGATADVPGPSRYFQRLATEAARKWTFTPAASPAERVMLVRFNFTRAGTTASAHSP